MGPSSFKNTIRRWRTEDAARDPEQAVHLDPNPARRLRNMASTPMLSSEKSSIASSSTSKRSFFRCFSSCRTDPSVGGRSSSADTTPELSPNTQAHFSLADEKSASLGRRYSARSSFPARADSAPPYATDRAAEESTESLLASRRQSLLQYHATSTHRVTPKLHLQMPTASYATQKILPRMPLSAVEQSPNPTAGFEGAVSPSSSSSRRRKDRRPRRPATTGTLRSAPTPYVVQGIPRYSTTTPGGTPPPPKISILGGDDAEDPPSPCPIGDDVEMTLPIPKLSPRPIIKNDAGRRSPNVSTRLRRPASPPPSL